MTPLFDRFHACIILSQFIHSVGRMFSLKYGKLFLCFAYSLDLREIMQNEENVSNEMAYSLCCLSASLSFLDASWWSKSELRLTMADLDERARDLPRDSTTVLNYRLIPFSNSRGKVCRVGTSLLDSIRGSRIDARLRLFSRFTAGAERGSPPNTLPIASSLCNTHSWDNSFSFPSLGREISLHNYNDDT